MKGKKQKLIRSLLAGLVAGITIIPATVMAEDYEAKITGDPKLDTEDYADVMKVTDNGLIYDFKGANEAETTIEAVTPITNEKMAMNITINANKLNLTGDMVSTGINAVEDSKIIINADNVKIDATGLDGVRNGGIILDKEGVSRGGKASFELNGSLVMGQPRGDSWTLADSDFKIVPGYNGSRWAHAAINLSEGFGSYMNFNGDVNVASKGIAVKTDPYFKTKGMDDKDISIINFNGNTTIITPEDKKMTHYALANFGGTINVNYNNNQPSDKNVVKIDGNIIVSKVNDEKNDQYYRDGYINLGLVNKNSSWHGVVDNFGAATAGEVNLYLQNGATWTHEALSPKDGMDNFNLPEESSEYYDSYDGVSHINKLAGGTEKAAGVIIAKDPAKIAINDYSGHVKVIYAHDHKGETKADYKAGDVEIKQAQANSGITLATDNTNVDTADKLATGKTLNALASKLTYKAKDNNLTGKVEILEGLTASAAGVNLGDIEFKDNGEGSLKADSIKDTAVEKPIPTDFSKGITGGVDKVYADAKIKKGNDYTFSQPSSIDTPNSTGISLKKSGNYSVAADELNISHGGAGNSFGIEVAGGANVNVKVKDLTINSKTSANYVKGIFVSNGNLKLNGKTSINMINAQGETSGIYVDNKGTLAVDNYSFTAGEDKAKPIYALHVTNGKATVANDGDTIELKGNVYTHSEDGQATELKMVLNNGASLDGTFIYKDATEYSGDEWDPEETVFTPGVVNLTLTNGGTWFNHVYGKAAVNSDYNFKGSIIDNLVGGNTEAEAGDIVQMDKKPITIKNYSGYMNVFYDNDKQTPTKLLGGDFIVEAAKKGSQLTLWGNAQGAGSESYTQMLGDLAGKLYYKKAINNQDDNLKVRLGLQEGLTSSAVIYDTGRLKFDAKTGQGLLAKDNQSNTFPQDAPEVPSHFTKAITGGEDKAYAEPGIKVGNNYNFSMDSSIYVDNGTTVDIKKMGKFNIDMNGHNLTLQHGGSGTSKGINLQDGTLNIAANKVNIISKADAMTVSAVNVSAGNLKIAGMLDVNMKDAHTKPNVSHSDKLVGLGQQQKSHVDLDGYKFSAGDNKETSVYGVFLTNSTANINMADNKAGNNLVQIDGDIYTHSENYKKTQLDMALNTPESYLNGAVVYKDYTNEADIDDEYGEDEVFKPGTVNLTLANGGTWTNKVFGHNKQEADWNFQGSLVENFAGGMDAEHRGIVKQLDKRDLTINNYSGNTLFIYEHDSADPTKFAAGNTIVNKAAKDSVITLRTDHNGVTKTNIAQVLSKLANKLYYKNANEDSNLNGFVEIAEGLTASAKSVKLGNIKFDKRSGEGQYKEEEEVKPPTTSPVTPGESTKPEETKPGEVKPGTETKPGDTTKPVTPGGTVNPPVEEVDDNSIHKPTVETEDKYRLVDYSKGGNFIADGSMGDKSAVAGIYIKEFTRGYDKMHPMIVDLNGYEETVDVKGNKKAYGIYLPGSTNMLITDKSGKNTSSLKLSASTPDTRVAAGIMSKGGDLTVDVPVVFDNISTKGRAVKGITIQKGETSFTFNNDVTINKLINGDKKDYDLNLYGAEVVSDESELTIKGKLTAKDVKGTILSTVGRASEITVASTDISVAEDGSRKKHYYAANASKGYIHLGVHADYDKKIYVTDNKDVKITGDIFATKMVGTKVVEYTGGKLFPTRADGGVDIALVTKDSKWTGALKHEDSTFVIGYDGSGGAEEKSYGYNRMWLANGGTWDNKALNDNIIANNKSDNLTYRDWDGAHLTALKAGDSEANQGYIIQHNDKPIFIDDYSGRMTVGFDHNASNPTEIYGGQVKVVKAQADSVITLRTDNQGIDTSKGVNSAPVFNVLKSLAGKLVYEGATTGENNLVAKGEIVEGLTASAISADFVKNYTFDKTTGVAQLEGEPTPEEPITPPSTGEEQPVQPGGDVNPPISGEEQPVQPGGEVNPPTTGEQPGTTVEPEQPSTGDQTGTTTKPEKPSTGETTKPEKPGTTVTPGSEESTVQPGSGEPTVQPGSGEPSVQPGSGEENPGIVIDPDKIVTKAYETKAMQSMRAAHENLFIGMRTLLNDVDKRLGDVRFNTKDAGFWVKLEHAKASYNGHNINANLKGNGIHMGYDRLTDHNWLVGGEISHLSTKGDHALGSSKGSINSLGIYGTKVNKDGSYVDIISKYGAIKNDLNHFVNNQKLTGQVKVKTTTFSVETGKRITDAKGGFIQPQVELSYGHMPKTHFIMQAKKATMDTSYTALNSLVARLGVAAGKTTDKGSWQGTLSVHRELMGTNAGIFTGENTKKVNYDYKDTWFTIGLSGTAKMGDNSTIYGKLSKDFGGKYGKGYNFSVGARWMF